MWHVLANAVTSGLDSSNFRVILETQAHAKWSFLNSFSRIEGFRHMETKGRSFISSASIANITRVLPNRKKYIYPPVKVLIHPEELEKKTPISCYPSAIATEPEKPSSTSGCWNNLLVSNSNFRNDTKQRSTENQLDYYLQVLNPFEWRHHKSWFFVKLSVANISVKIALVD